MPGKVYCFNCYNEPIQRLNANGLSTGSIPGWATSGAGIYTPASIAIARVRHGDGQSSPAFPNDQPTPLRIDWDSYTVQTSINLQSLPGVSLDDDLILYIALNRLTLMSMRGLVLLSQSHSPER